MAVTLDEYNNAESALRDEFAKIFALAARLHDVDANQRYGANLPYSYHLNAVATLTMEYAPEVIAAVDDLLPLYFGACFHDSIEDARQTYNDVLAIARTFMDESQAVMATEIAYALTNDKGRTRAERAGERYYAGIRTTPYAPMVKLADRLANMTYSLQRACQDANAERMVNVYRGEMPHFLAAITSDTADPRLALPPSMLERINSL